MDGETSNVFIFDVVGKRWSKAPASGPHPAARYGHTATVVGSQMVVIGGRAGTNSFFNDVWTLDLSAFFRPSCIDSLQLAFFFFRFFEWICH